MFLGPDLGTSSLKAVLVDDSQAVVGHASLALTVRARIPAGASRTGPTGWRR